MAMEVFFRSLTLVSGLAQALVYGLGGYLAAARVELDAGTVVTMALLLNQLYAPLTALATARLDVVTALVSFERVFEVLDIEPLIAEPADPQPLPDGPVAVELDDVRFGYPSADKVSLASLEEVAVLDDRAGDEVLHDVSFRVEPGQTVALVGASGAGKSTLASLVPRLYDADDGAVRCRASTCATCRSTTIRATVGVVTQDGHLFHDTIRANLRYAAPGGDRRRAVGRRSRRPGSDALVRSLPDGLDTVVGERGYRLSGGERQRLTIARLLLARPRVVILDEATAHLDSASEVAVQEALVAALAGRTALVIAHRLSTVRAADAILVVDDGRVVERGTHTELLAAGGRYAELYRTQFADADTPTARRRRLRPGTDRGRGQEWPRNRRRNPSRRSAQTRERRRRPTAPAGRRGGRRAPGSRRGISPERTMPIRPAIDLPSYTGSVSIPSVRRGEVDRLDRLLVGDAVDRAGVAVDDRDLVGAQARGRARCASAVSGRCG